MDDEGRTRGYPIRSTFAGSSRDFFFFSCSCLFLFFHSSFRLYSRYPRHLLAVSLLLIYLEELVHTSRITLTYSRLNFFQSASSRYSRLGQLSQVKRSLKSINQSINQSTNQSINQSINQSTDQPNKAYKIPYRSRDYYTQRHMQTDREQMTGMHAIEAT